MAAEIKPNIDNNRQHLADIIPLDAPFTVYLEVSRVCNLKCFYCIISTADDPDGDFAKLQYKKKLMSREDFQKIVTDLTEFPPKSLKRAVFSGLGEPLCHPDLPEYISAIAKTGIFDRLEVITNGLLLTKEKIDSLLASGLTNINISIQGLNADTYEEVCGVRVDYDKFLDNLQYLYQNRGEVKIYIKIIDAALKNEQEHEQFYEMFSKMADRIYIEHLIQMQQSHSKIKDDVAGDLSFYGQEIDPDRMVCAPAFYFMQIGADLDIFPCPPPGLPRSLSMGNAKEKSLLEIWNGEKRREFLKMMLRKQKDKIPACRGCTCYNSILDPSENLDPDAEALLKRFE